MRVSITFTYDLDLDDNATDLQRFEAMQRERQDWLDGAITTADFLPGELTITADVEA